MITLSAIQVGKVSLIDKISLRPVTDASHYQVEYRSDSSPRYLPSPFNCRIDALGNLLLLSAQPALSLQREFAADDYHFRVRVQAPTYQSSTSTITVTKAAWDAFVAQVDALDEGQLDAPWQLLFDETAQMEPNAVAAELSLRRQNHQAINPDDYVLEVISPSSVNGQAIGSLNIWKFYPLPVADKVTVEVRLSADNSVVTSAEFGIDYTKTLNAWELAINH